MNVRSKNKFFLYDQNMRIITTEDHNFLSVFDTKTLVEFLYKLVTQTKHEIFFKLFFKKIRAGDVTQFVKCLPSICKTQGLIASITHTENIFLYHIKNILGNAHGLLHGQKFYKFSFRFKMH
jgi:hypothetical protein